MDYVANMGVMNVYSLDIEEFINAKSYDEGKLVHFNLSVMVDDDFITAVKNDKEVSLHFPVYDDDGKILKDETKWTLSKKVSAKHIWNMIMDKAYDNGEPGIFFYDNLNRDNNLWYIENIVASNPCFTGDMKLLTVDGYRTFKELEGKSVNVISEDGSISKNNKVWCSGYKEIVEIKFSNGKVIKCTPNHIFKLTDNSECEAQNLINKEVKCYGEHYENQVVCSVIDIGKEYVYDFTENINHWGIVNGFVVHNCAEYLAGTVYGNNPQTGEKLNKNDYGGACNLGSVFLHNFVEEPFTNKALFNYQLFRTAIRTGVRFLDNIIDINKSPDKIYENYQKSFRTIGIGVTGLADALAMLNLKYSSEKARIFVDELMNYFAYTVYEMSIELAREKGSFPFLDREKFVQSGFIQKHLKKDKTWKNIVDGILEYGIRNGKMISIAPTGTLSLTYGNNCSSGIEPIFSLSYDRKIKIGGQSDDDIKIVSMKDYAYDLWQNTKDGNIVSEDAFVTALDMSVDEHIDMLKTIAFHADMSVSKTINVPTEYSKEDTKNIYMKCWESGIKGCTIFRPNAIRQGVMITEPKKDDKADSKIVYSELQRGDILSVNDDVIGKKRKLITGCGSLHCTAFFEPSTGQLVETYLSKGSTGGCNSFMVGLSRMISLSARLGCDIDTIVDQLNSCVACPSYAVRNATKHDTSKGSCCPIAIGNALKEMYVEIQNELNCDEEECEEEDIVVKNPCPKCKEELSFEGGCSVCKSCGWSKCS